MQIAEAAGDRLDDVRRSIGEIERTDAAAAERLDGPDLGATFTLLVPRLALEPRS